MELGQMAHLYCALWSWMLYWCDLDVLLLHVGKGMCFFVLCAVYRFCVLKLSAHSIETHCAQCLMQDGFLFVC